MGQAQTLIAKALLNTPLEDIYVVVENYLRLIGYHSNFQVGILGRASALVASGEGLGFRVLKWSSPYAMKTMP